MSITEQLFQKIDKKKQANANKEYDPDNFWQVLGNFGKRRNTDTDRGSWTTYGDKLDKHLNTFEQVFDRSEIAELMREHPDGLVAVEGMGPGQVLRELEGRTIDDVQVHLKKGIALTLSDERSDQQRTEDAAREWFHPIYGNVLNESTIHELEDQLGDDQIDFFICRPVGGLKYMPLVEHPLSAILFYDLVNTVYKKMAENGKMLLQFDSSWRNILEEWTNHLNELHPNSATLGDDPRRSEYMVIKLIKNSNENLEQIPGNKLRALFRSSRGRLWGRGRRE